MFLTEVFVLIYLLKELTQFLLPETYPLVIVLKGRSLHFFNFFYRHNTARISLNHPTKTLVLRIF
jgi:hypothetical protein